MKELQRIVESYMTDYNKHKKYLAVLTALSILISFTVSFTLIEPAISTTGDGVTPRAANGDATSLTNYTKADGNIVNGTTYSPASMSVKDLLIGKVGDGDDSHSWADGCETASDIIEAAQREYFLGIAYDFCVFLEGDFTPKNADSEI